MSVLSATTVEEPGRGLRTNRRASRDQGSCAAPACKASWSLSSALTAASEEVSMSFHAKAMRNCATAASRLIVFADCSLGIANAQSAVHDDGVAGDVTCQ